MKWLFLVHQVRTPNSRERVKVWRLVKKTGALLYRNSVYVLPYSKDRLEDFQWVCQQIRDSKGEASVFISESQDAKEDRLLHELFETNRQQEYRSLLQPAKNLLTRIRSKKDAALAEDLYRSFHKERLELQRAFEEIAKVDFFSSGAPREVSSVFDQLKKQLQDESSSNQQIRHVRRYKRADYQGKTWTTRDHIYIDRIASAWLIRRFIDPRAVFLFAPENELPKDAVPFDVFGAEFSHQGDDCTFEVLLKSFQIRDRALEAIGQIVHDIDLKDHKFDRPEAAGIDAAMRGLTSSVKNDAKLLELGSLIFDGLHANLSSKNRRNQK
jgi:hypothetical protein